VPPKDTVAQSTGRRARCPDASKSGAPAIADRIRVSLNPREQAALKNKKAVDPKAYEAFLKKIFLEGPQRV